MRPKEGVGIANSVDPDQTPPREQSELLLRSSLNWVYTVCQDVSFRKIRTIKKTSVWSWLGIRSLGFRFAGS